MPCVTDSNIWIDLNHAGLIPEFFTCRLDLYSTDLIIGELVSVDTDELERCGLEIVSLDAAQLERVTELSGLYRGPSPRDLSVLVAAIDLGAMVVTGDSSLRAAASNEGVEAHGLLWVLDSFLEREIINATRAYSALRGAIENNAWLPEDEVATRLRRWEPRP